MSPRARKTNVWGFNAGMAVGIHAVLLFTFLAEPGRWLFAEMRYGQALIAYGYSMMLVIAACCGAGILVERLLAAFLASKEQNDAHS